MPLIDSYVDFAMNVKTILIANKLGLGLQDVFYGDQARIPRTPAACVEPGGKRRELNGLPRKTEVVMTTYIIVYHHKLSTSQDILQATDTLAEDIEAVLHLDVWLRDGNGDRTVIDSMVTEIESGVQTKSNSLFRASRLTFEARSQMLLPQPITP